MPQPDNLPLVLIADDDMILRMLARECLSRLGFAIAEAKDGQEAFDACVALEPDLVILDVMMPEVDGYQACRKIRALPGMENLPILIMTALDDVDAVNEAFESGANEYTLKPINWIVEAYRLRNMIKSAAAHREVYLARQEWERSFNAMDDIVIIHDRNLRIIQANAAAHRALSLPEGSLIGKHCREIFGCSNETCQTCPSRKVLSSGRRQLPTRMDGHLNGTFLVSAFPIHDDSGELSRIVYMAKDISIQDRLEAELMRAQKLSAIGTLSGGLAHDFNNLLQIIIGNTDMAALDISPEMEAFACLSEIRNAATRGREMVAQLMMLGRGNKDNAKTALCLNQLVENLMVFMQRTFPRNIEFDLKLDEDLGLAMGNQSQLEQVFMNLAVNAKQAMPNGGRLCIETGNVVLKHEDDEPVAMLDPGKYVWLKVEDSGCGMDEETLSHIFEPFFTTKHPGDGTGLGLASVYGIIQRHGGGILCQSRPGAGTSFEIYLPAGEHV